MKSQRLRSLSAFIALVLSVLPSCSKCSGPSKPVQVTEVGGLKIEDLKLGSGELAETGKAVAVQYTGTFLDGRTFDSSRGREAPFTFTLGSGGVIKGWEQGMQGMKVGGVRRLTIPPDLGYGTTGAGDVIPPNTTLVFEIELVGVTKSN